jgi:hypothetical protein
LLLRRGAREARHGHLLIRRISDGRNARPGGARYVK